MATSFLHISAPSVLDRPHNFSSVGSDEALYSSWFENSWGVAEMKGSGQRCKFKSFLRTLEKVSVGRVALLTSPYPGRVLLLLLGTRVSASLS